MNTSYKPLVSIFCTCKNAETTIRRHIQAVLVAMQRYENIEYVVQDGLSTDGTLKIFDEYRGKFGDRLRLISAPDSCCEEGFWLALSRCQGEIICASLADEEILPDAIPFVVAKFKDNPDIDVIHGDIYNTDIEGNIICRNQSTKLDLVTYLSHKSGVHLAASFFKKSAFEKSYLLPFPGKYGLLKDDFFTWAHLGLHCHIEYIPKVFAKYAVHEAALSVNPKRIPGIMSGRSDFLDSYFNLEMLPYAIQSKKKYIMFNFYSYVADLLQKNQFHDEAKVYSYKKTTIEKETETDALIYKNDALYLPPSKLIIYIGNIMWKLRRILRQMYKLFKYHLPGNTP
jgi:glycosyltransferase involved in cell wall biosynthesis